MTEDSVTAFLTRLAEDTDLRSEWSSSFLSEDVVALAARHGYEFTIDELTQHVAPLSAAEWSAAALKFDQRDSPDSYFLFLEELPMSTEALGAFFKKVAEDRSMQAKLVEFAAQNGFEFSLDELSDVDLDSVTGGIKEWFRPAGKKDESR